MVFQIAILVLQAVRYQEHNEILKMAKVNYQVNAS